MRREKSTLTGRPNELAVSSGVGVVLAVELI
jgi:hypothetical protein